MTQAQNVAELSSDINSSGVLQVIGGGTGTTTSTGTGNTVLSTSPTLVTPALGTPSSGVVTNLTGTASININGTVGATTPAAGTFTSLSDSGNLTFTGTGNRITGDFSNGTVANRVAFQTSTANSSTTIWAIPNGTGTASAVGVFNNSDPTNSSYINIQATSTEGRFNSAITGTGTYLPLTMYTSGSERLRITTAGIVDIGGTSGGSVGELLVVEGANSAGHRAARINNTSTTNGYSTLWMGSSNDGLIRAGSTAGSFTDQLLLLTSGAIPISFYTANTERMRIDSSGNVGIGTSSPNIVGLNRALTINSTSNQQGIEFAVSGAVKGLIQTNGDTEFIMGSFASIPLTFRTANTERMRIDSSGYVGINTSAPSNYGRFAVNAAFTSTSAPTVSTSTLGLANDATTQQINTGPSLVFYGVTRSSPKEVQPQAGFKAAKENSTDDNMASYLAFYTNDNAARALTEKMRIASAGQIGIGGANYGTSGQVLTSGGASAAPSWANASSAGISQVVQTVKTDTFTMASTTYADITGLSVTITPSSSSSKILVMANVNHVGTTLTSASGIRLMRDSTAIGIGDTAGSRIRTSGGESYGNYGVTLTGDAIMFLDSPATTSATTYKIQIRVYGSTAYVNRSGTDSDDQAYYRGMSSITVMEVK
jgi:hypothetical protein